MAYAILCGDKDRNTLLLLFPQRIDILNTHKCNGMWNYHRFSPNFEHRNIFVNIFLRAKIEYVRILILHTFPTKEENNIFNVNMELIDPFNLVPNPQDVNILNNYNSHCIRKFSIFHRPNINVTLLGTFPSKFKIKWRKLSIYFKTDTSQHLYQSCRQNCLILNYFYILHHT